MKLYTDTEFNSLSFTSGPGLIEVDDALFIKAEVSMLLCLFKSKKIALQFSETVKAYCHDYVISEWDNPVAAPDGGFGVWFCDQTAILTDLECRKPGLQIHDFRTENTPKKVR